MENLPGTVDRPLLTGLGYVGLRSDRLQDWESFSCDFLGMQKADATSGRRAFRMDDHAQRLIVQEDQDADAYFGWETTDAGSLQRVAQRLDDARVSHRELTRIECAERQVAAGITLLDPDGHRVEVVYGSAMADSAFTPSRPISGFRTGGLGMGHAVLTSDNPEPMRTFYTEVLGFLLSDFTREPFEATFYHLNPRHHSLAIVRGPRTGIHHLMVELNNLDDVGQGYDIAQRRPEGIGVTLGRHSNDHMTSFYARTPSGFMVEYGWGGLTLDPVSWEPFELFEGPSLWGHDRDWLPPDLQQLAVDMRMQAARDGKQAPVHVHGTNYDTNDHLARWEQQGAATSTDRS